jgi:four helix bundle protein
MEIKNFKDLRVWQKGKELALKIYSLTSVFPKEECYGLTSQMRRSSVSIPCNIAEGFNRYYSKEYRRFLYIAQG